MPESSAELDSGTGDGIQVSGREENWSTVATPGQLAFTGTYMRRLKPAKVVSVHRSFEFFKASVRTYK